MSKHTPGPWRVDEIEAFDDELWIMAGEGRAIAKTGLGFNSDVDATNRANAALIAAAPDLLEALRAVEEAFVVDYAPLNAAQTVAVRRMDAAIARATGQEVPA